MHIVSDPTALYRYHPLIEKPFAITHFRISLSKLTFLNFHTVRLCEKFASSIKWMKFIIRKNQFVRHFNNKHSVHVVDMQRTAFSLISTIFFFNTENYYGNWFPGAFYRRIRRRKLYESKSLVNDPKLSYLNRISSDFSSLDRKMFE